MGGADTVYSMQHIMHKIVAVFKFFKLEREFSILKVTLCCHSIVRLYLWNIQRLRQEPPLSLSHVPIPPDAHACVGDSWQPPAQPCGLTDMLVYSVHLRILLSLSVSVCTG